MKDIKFKKKANTSEQNFEKMWRTKTASRLKAKCKIKTNWQRTLWKETLYAVVADIPNSTRIRWGQWAFFQSTAGYVQLTKKERKKRKKNTNRQSTFVKPRNRGYCGKPMFALLFFFTNRKLRQTKKKKIKKFKKNEKVKSPTNICKTAGRRALR